MQVPLGTLVVAENSADGNVTEALFVLNLLLCSRVPCRVKVSSQHLWKGVGDETATLGGGGGGIGKGAA